MRRLKVIIPVAFVIAIIIIVPLAVVFTTSDPGETLVVRTTVGLIRGMTSDDGSFSKFLGIPYAVVDKNNPFGAATPNPVFEDVFNAFEDTKRCPQYSENSKIEGSLDCLTLNVFVPKENNEKPKPILVFIHGGAFMTGSSAMSRFGPKFLVRQNVIYVSVHYRVAAYGFICLHTPQVPGNQGLKDQLNALRWIKNNIKAFGGDDENITIVGDSAGGMSVDLQLLFAEDGLFHKVIMQSGTSLSPFTIYQPDLDVAFKIAKQLGFNTTDIDAAVEFLSKQETDQVVQAVEDLGVEFKPCVEKEFENVENFIKHEWVTTPMVKAKDIPIIVGYNDDEALFMHGHLTDEEFEKAGDVFDKHMKMGFTFEDNYEAMKLYVKRFYAGDEPYDAKIRRTVIDFTSDFLFLNPAQRTIAKYLDNDGKVFHYVFSYVGERNMLRVAMNITIGGTCHSDELGYLFDWSYITTPPTPDDQLVIDRLTTLWTNFAKYGDPTPTTTDLLPVKWLPVTRERMNYLTIGKDIFLGARPFHQRLTFWDFYYETNKEYVRGYTRE